MIDCTLVTCEELPSLDPDDRLLAGELRRRGVSVGIATWSDPRVAWEETRLCVLRSTWDYHYRYDEFLRWIARTASVTRLRNGPGLVAWNADKAYLRDMAQRGVPVVPTAWLARGARCALDELAATNGWRRIVIKPARGAAAHDVMLVAADRTMLTRGQGHLDRLLRTQEALVQPYLESVETYGERALMFFRGEYSHAVVKKPFDTVLKISDARSTLVTATDDEIAAATSAIAAIPGDTLYARVDLLRDDAGGACVNEVELIEPALYVGVHDPARTLFADAIVRELDEPSAPTPVAACGIG
ncbi:MAG TPA: hypothetical protein VGF86_04035 [Candidatus Tumulicola sp.]